MRECARVLDISKTTVGAIVSMVRVAGVDWVLAQTLSDDELEARVYRPAVPRASRHLEPDFALIHQELRRPGVTLQLLWEDSGQFTPASRANIAISLTVVLLTPTAAATCRMLRPESPASS
jgi:hypothetical protein